MRKTKKPKPNALQICRVMMLRWVADWVLCFLTGKKRHILWVTLTSNANTVVKKRFLHVELLETFTREARRKARVINEDAWCMWLWIIRDAACSVRVFCRIVVQREPFGVRLRRQRFFSSLRLLHPRIVNFDQCQVCTAELYCQFFHVLFARRWRADGRRTRSAVFRSAIPRSLPQSVKTLQISCSSSLHPNVLHNVPMLSFFLHPGSRSKKTTERSHILFFLYREHHSTQRE